MPTIPALNELTNPVAADKLAVVDDSADTTKYMTVGTLLKLIFPIGSHYSNETDDTNPATLFGFGTWQRVQGKFIVGVDDSDPTFAEGATGGEKNHQLSMAELPAFNFGFSLHGDENGSQLRGVFANGGSVGGYGVGQYRPPANPIGGAASHVQPSWNFGGNAAHNNLPPFGTAYIWVRTA